MKARGAVTDKITGVFQVLHLPRKTGQRAVEGAASIFQQTNVHPSKMPYTLPRYISLLLAMTAIIPLLATILSLEFFLRPALVNQVNDALERDAQTKVQLIETYLIERLNEVQAMSQSTLIRNFLAGDQSAKSEVFDALVTAQHRDVSHYVSWSLLDPSEHVVLSYPTAPDTHGKYFILPEASRQLQKSGQVLVSDVFYDAINNLESVDLYAHVVDDNFHLLGFVRASLDLRNIWAIVDSETQANGPGSYGVLLDENGVRIAYTNTNPTNGLRPTLLLKAIAPLSANLKPSQTALLVNATLASSTPAGIPASPSVCMSVKDSGPGIPPDDISLLFEKFGRLNRDASSSIRGVGLGLYISKQLVQAMGGHIWVESSGIAGQGSRFCFTLPLAANPADEETLQTDATMGEES